MSTINQSTLKSITQYDKRFDGLFDEIKKKGFACSYFSILSCWKFMQQNSRPDLQSHEQHIKDAMTITCVLNLADGLGFEDLIIGCTDFDHKKIIATSVELIVQNVIGIHQMFPKILEETEKYAVMFLKSEKYFVVLVDKDGYYVRDCHIDTQYNFKTLDQLYAHLATTYQFTENVNVGGIEFEEYSSIEFLKFDTQFNTDVVAILGTKLYSDDKPNVFNKSQYDDFADDSIYDLDGDIFDLPEKILLTQKDIEYLEMLNVQLNGEVKNYVEDFDNEPYDISDFTTTIDNNIDPDDLVDFE